ncbi:hypothetical protein D3C80_1966470 [compost metagenome]
MAPAPDLGFEHEHEARQLVDRIIHPAGFERRPVTGFVPTGIGRRAVKQAIDEEERNTGPGAPEPVTAEPGHDHRQQPDRGIAQGRAIAALHQFLHAFTGNG